ncbi:MEMO1 family [Parasitella parasitica]|nr:MEMO1 family [Parasitella parasitica]
MERSATHAGSWYTSDEARLNGELEFYLRKAKEKSQQELPIKGVRAIIGPHAGLKYSGPTAGFAYKAIDTSDIKRIFLLGPSHHAYIDGCSLSECSTYHTPFGNIKLDREVIEELYNTEKFEWMSKDVDEKEHSIEMHLPFAYKVFEEKIDDISLVPILVGSISAAKERLYGQLLANYLQDPQNLFIISSDFCHWGSRFNYTYYTKSTNHNEKRIDLELYNKGEIERPIYESIRDLDVQGIKIMETLSFDDFQSYLRGTNNTICGRHPIAVLMAALEALRKEKKSLNQTLKCLYYDQSSKCKRYSDSSVSYASFYVQID